MRKILIWDPNPFNPYGAEVARAIASGGRDVLRVCRHRDRWQVAGTRRLRFLPPPSNGAAGIPQHVYYMLGLVATILICLLLRPVLVCAWITTGPEALMVRTLQVLGIQTVVIVHNPIASRDEVDAKHMSAAARARAKASTLVVHRSGLSQYLNHGNVRVAGHPAYFAWKDEMERSLDNCATRSRECRALYLGSTRPDKGFQHLPPLSHALSQLSMGLSIAISVIQPEAAIAIGSCVNTRVVGDGKTYLSDEQIFHELTENAVLVAPYRDVTASGTALMALTMGLPVAAFDTPGMRQYLPAEFLAPPDDVQQLAITATHLANASKMTETAKLMAMSIDADSIKSWRIVLDELVH